MRPHFWSAPFHVGASCILPAFLLSPFGASCRLVGCLHCTGTKAIDGGHRVKGSRYNWLTGPAGAYGGIQRKKCLVFAIYLLVTFITHAKKPKLNKNM